MGQIETIRDISQSKERARFGQSDLVSDTSPNWINALVNLTPHGIMLLDRNAGVLACNQSFTTTVELLLGRPIYFVIRGAEVLALPGFDKAYHDACSGFSSTVSISNETTKRSSFCFSPFNLYAHESIVSITTSRQLFGNDATLATFASRNRLTQTECNVVRYLAQGENPEAIAAKTRVMLSTVRSHIRSVLEKVGADSIRALLVLLAELPIQNESTAQNKKTVFGSRR